MDVWWVGCVHSLWLRVCVCLLVLVLVWKVSCVVCVWLLYCIVSCVAVFPCNSTVIHNTHFSSAKLHCNALWSVTSTGVVVQSLYVTSLLHEDRHLAPP